MYAAAAARSRGPPAKCSFPVWWVETTTLRWLTLIPLTGRGTAKYATAAAPGEVGQRARRGLKVSELETIAQVLQELSDRLDKARSGGKEK